MINNKLKEIEKIAGGNEAIIKEIIAILIRQTSEQIIQLEFCLKNKDHNELKKTAHALKSTFLHLDMPDAIQLTESIQKTANFTKKVTVKKTEELIAVCRELVGMFDTKPQN